MRQAIEAQHRKLDGVFEGMRAALRSGDGAQVRDAFARLRQALEAHFDQEDRLYYPAIRALRPERKAALYAFVEAHEQFRTRFGEIATRLGAGGPDEVEEPFERFAEDFAEHEVVEEELLKSLDAELEAAH